MIPTLDIWDAYSSDERKSAAQQLARELPAGFTLKGLESVEWLGRIREIAAFEFAAARFVLVPGGEVTLGFDGSSFAPTAEQIESFVDSAATYEIRDSIQTFVGKTTTPRRRAQINPLLVEAEAWEASLVPAAVDDPAILQLAAEVEPRHTGAELHIGDKHAKLELADGKVVRAWWMRYRTPEVLRQDIRKGGFRLLTSDEWEYACGAGAPTLFRWGDPCPNDRYPSDTEATSSSSPWTEFEVHRKPNAFGLKIAFDPYITENVEEIGVARGGDGGASTCGGAGAFLGWLPLATAYFEPELASCVDEFGWVRRVLSLG